MGYGVDILNTIRNNASDEYQARIPVATQENITQIGNSFQTYELLFNEFKTALVNKIGKTILEQKLFKNKLAKYKSGKIMSGQDVEEIFVEMAKAEGAYDPAGTNPLGRRSGADVKVFYHRMNRQDYYVVTIGDIDFNRVFRSESTLEEFVRGLINSVYSGAEYDEWLAMKNVLATYKNEEGTAPGYFDYGVTALNGTNNAKACTDFVKTLRKAVLDLTVAPSTQYNVAGVKTWSKAENLVLYIHKDLISEIDVEVLAKAFNMGKTDIQVDIEVMDDFGELTDTYAILADRDFLKVWDVLSHMEPQRNAHGLFTNYFYHIHQILSASRFKNAVRFTTKTVA